MLEYVLVFTALFAVVGALALFVRGARNAAERTTELVTAECP